MKKRPLLFFLPIFVCLNLSWSTSPLAPGTYNWVGGATGEWNVAANWQNGDGIPGPPAKTDNVIIDGNFTVALPSSVATTVKSLFLKNGADLIIENGATLNTRQANSNGEGVSLDPNCTLTVNGILNINDATVNASDIGLDIGQNATVSIGSMGALNVTNAPTRAINVQGILTNDGSITIANSVIGIFTESAVVGSIITNNKDITITGGTTGMNLGSVNLDNHGTIIISRTSGYILDGAGNLRNYGTFGGDGTVGASDFKPQNPSTISPGTSVGTLTFDGPVDFDGVTLNIEINGAGSYDQITVQGDALNVDQATLSLSGAYTPVSGNTFDILMSNNTPSGIGGAPFTLNGVSMNLSFVSGMTKVSFGSSLPVELTHFTARATGKAIQLNWSTATEANNDYFSIEHAADGRHFSEIGRLFGAGTAQAAHHYTFKHHAPEKGLNYYRLNQHDFDGASAYSNVQAVFLEDTKHWTVQPALARDVVRVEWTEAQESGAVIAVFNLAGQKVYSQEVYAGTTNVQIPVAHLASGMYWVLVQENGKVDTQRFVKE